MVRQAYRINKAGSLSNLKLIEEELPDPTDNEVTIEVKAIGLNFADLFALQGLYSATPKGSFIPGLEYSGKVYKKGKNVTDFSIGDYVMGVIRFGTYTTHLNIDCENVQKLPHGWSFEEGAAFIVQSLTAYYALLELGNFKENDTVLIHSAAGGVGIYANRIAKKFNAYTIGTVSSSTKVNFLKAEGYDKVIVRGDNFKERLIEALKRRELNIVLESVGGKIFADSFNQLSPRGRIIIYGSAQFMSRSSRPNYFKLLYKFLTRPKIDPLSLTDKNRSVMGFNLIYLWNKPDEMKRFIKIILGMNLRKPYVGNIFTFYKLPDALKLFQSGKTIGKVVVKV
ncbi:MAG: zinc-binding dehydrogenase [Ignavibacteria bacterium]|nr:zinc-binding dehydrogenase [Ignavibacteria bacterium]